MDNTDKKIIDRTFSKIEFYRKKFLNFLVLKKFQEDHYADTPSLFFPARSAGNSFTLENLNKNFSTFFFFPKNREVKLSDVTGTVFPSRGQKNF